MARDDTEKKAVTEEKEESQIKDRHDWDTEDTEQEPEQPDTFQRLYAEYKEGRLSPTQAVGDVLAVLAGEPVDRHYAEDDPEGFQQELAAREKSRQEAASQ